jgi:hypothetical protein
MMFGGRRSFERMSLLRSKTAFLAVAIAAALYVHGSPLGHAQRFVTQTQNSIASAIAGPQFSDAAMSLELYRQAAGTYAGAGIEGRRITVRWATDSAYCVEGVRQSGAVDHLVGPHGRLAPGQCPYATS